MILREVLCTSNQGFVVFMSHPNGIRKTFRGRQQFDSQYYPESRNAVICLASLRGVNQHVRGHATYVFCPRNRVITCLFGYSQRIGFMQDAQRRSNTLLLEVVQKAQKLELHTNRHRELWPLISALSRAGPISVKTLTIRCTASGSSSMLHRWQPVFRKHRFPHLGNLVWQFDQPIKISCHTFMLTCWIPMRAIITSGIPDCAALGFSSRALPQHCPIVVCS
ncbi:hypothetical protein QBC38DRAFT_486846 [Podospora fimiseda]|uniref:Uncharacterized protein n=1 Tax=Podospora fimiseda TaxID=252190 RepID=A0AAN7BI26_9PEZI|nr:hypothetical protein QBC38DRAFT_486846 [Podospora fimiseda]